MENTNHKTPNPIHPVHFAHLEKHLLQLLPTAPNVSTDRTKNKTINTLLHANNVLLVDRLQQHPTPVTLVLLDGINFLHNPIYMVAKDAKQDKQQQLQRHRAVNARLENFKNWLHPLNTNVNFVLKVNNLHPRRHVVQSVLLVRTKISKIPHQPFVATVLPDVTSLILPLLKLTTMHKLIVYFV